MDKHLQQTTNFMTIAGQDIPTIPAIPSQQIVDLRESFIREENKELLEAALNGDIVEAADALCDLQVVLDGAFNSYGVSAIKELLMNEVYASNMSKFLNSEDECLQSIEKLMTEKLSSPVGRTMTAKWSDYYKYEQVGDIWVVKDLAGKVQKGIHYFKPDLKNIVDTFIKNQG